MPKGLLWQAVVAIIFRNFFEEANTEAFTLKLVVKFLVAVAVLVIANVVVVVVAVHMQSASVVARLLHRLPFLVCVLLVVADDAPSALRWLATLDAYVCLHQQEQQQQAKGLFPFNSRVIICH